MDPAAGLLRSVVPTTANGGAVVLLADRPDLAGTVAGWLFAEWHREGGLTRAQSDAVVAGRNRRASLPMALIALCDGAPAGTVSLLATAAGQPDSACLASLYVAPDWRNRGVACLLCHRAMAAASALSLRHLSCVTDGGITKYLRLGWTLERRIVVQGKGTAVREMSCALY